jgi:SAM-dependent methyltransferase
MRDKMRRSVKQGYEQGDYSAAFRRHGPPSETERLCLDRLLALTPPAPKILDFGCGTGLPVDKYLADRGADLTGIDISPKHVALAKGNLPSASYSEGDILYAVLPEGSFDGIVSFYAIFHIPRSEHEALFTRINQLLKPNGLFLATVFLMCSSCGPRAGLPLPLDPLLGESADRGRSVSKLPFSKGSNCVD